MLSSKIPRKFSITSGFILGTDENETGLDKKLSKQLDILIWNIDEHSPVFSIDNFAIVPPEATKAAIEIKGNLTNKELKKAIENLDSLYPFGKQFGSHNYPFTAIFAFKETKLNFPESIFQALYDFYQPSFLKRLSYANFNSLRWSLPWINQIVIMGVGVIHLIQANVNNTPTPAYIALKTADGKKDLSYGCMEYELLKHLSSGSNSQHYVETHPGMSALHSKMNFECVSCNSLLLMSDTINIINSIGRGSAEECILWNKRRFKPKHKNI